MAFFHHRICYRKIKFGFDENEYWVRNSFIFECSFSKQDNLYVFILTRIFQVYQGFGFGFSWSEYFQFFFSYYPLSKYIDFKGQLYSEDFSSLGRFFDVIETKQIFKSHMDSYKPVSIKYSISNELISNFSWLVLPKLRRTNVAADSWSRLALLADFTRRWTWRLARGITWKKSFYKNKHWLKMR